MSDIKEIFSEKIVTKRSSEMKTRKSIRRVSRLPKSLPNKFSSIQSKTSDPEQSQQQILDFPTRMQLKERISELQQLNNEMKFKLTNSEAKLRAKESELITSESLNKQIKHLLDKHIHREQELNCQMLTLEKKLAKANHKINELEEEARLFTNDKKEFHQMKQTNEELQENSELKDAQILDLSCRIADINRSLSDTLTNNKTLERQLDEAKKLEPMLDVRKNYINTLEVKVRQLEELCSNANEEKRNLKCEIDRLEHFRLQSLLAVIEKDTNLFQCQHEIK